MDDSDSTLAQHRSKARFSRFDARALSATDRMGAQFFKRDNTATSGSVRRFELPASFSGGHPSPLHSLGLAARAQGNVALMQSTSDDAAVDMEALRDSLDGITRQ